MANSPPAFALFWPLACTSRKSISTATCGLKTDFVGRFCATKSPQCEDARKFGYRREMPVFIVAKKAADPGSAPMYVDDFNSSGVGEMSRLGAEGAVGGSFLKMPSSDPAESLEWFYRDTEAVPGFNELPVLLLHGLPSQSYSFREVTPALKDAGFRSVAPDLIGWGFSNAPQAGYGFDYDPEEYLKTLTKFIDEIGLDRFHLCVQGFLGGPLGMELALSAPDRIEKLIILNSPLTAESAELPGAMGRMRFPILGEAISQDVISVERTLEKGGICTLRHALNLAFHFWAAMSDHLIGLDTCPMFCCFVKCSHRRASQ
mmetsp:Transcript_7495/g.11936  ORF Transcript_7495/g.11936 Transcript_7495/m.11936 type:complete len:317 (-) Transcript_7495:714-1664(-)